MTTEGAMEAAGEDMDREELEAGIAEMRARMAEMPESMRGMIQTQIDRLEGMLDGGAMTLEIVVSKVAVS